MPEKKRCAGEDEPCQRGSCVSCADGLTRRWVIVLVTGGLQMDGLAKTTDL